MKYFYGVFVEIFKLEYVIDAFLNINSSVFKILGTAKNEKLL